MQKRIKKNVIIIYTILFGLFFLVACSSSSSSSSTNHQTVVAQAVVTNEAQPKGEAEIEIRSFTPKHVFNDSHTYQLPPLVQEQPIQEATPKNSEAPIIRKKPQTRISKADPFTGVLQAHNGVRRKHGLQPLKWSNKLADYSRQWADHLGAGSHCQIRHRSGIPPYGENLYRASSLRWSTGETELLPVTIQNVVKAWTDEEKWYDYKQNRCQPGQLCGHYTQIVWRDTTEVGCALKICDDKSQTWVCSYNPPGNFQGVKPY